VDWCAGQQQGRGITGAEGSVRQFSCTIHVAAETWSRGTTKALGANGNFGRSTRTNHSCSEAAMS
jgi:hypothetical protein